MGAIIFFSALFGYAEQDRLNQDGGEQAAAGWMVGYHNAMRQNCRYAVFDCSSPGTVKLLPKDATYSPRYFGKDGAALAQGVQTISADNVLYTFYSTAPVGGQASRGAALSLQKIGARLADIGATVDDGTDFYSGIFSASLKTVFLGNGFTYQYNPNVDQVHSQSSGTTALKSYAVPADLGSAATVQDGAPVIASLVPCLSGSGACFPQGSVPGSLPTLPSAGLGPTATGGPKLTWSAPTNASGDTIGPGKTPPPYTDRPDVTPVGQPDLSAGDCTDPIVTSPPATSPNNTSTTVTRP